MCKLELDATQVAAIYHGGNPDVRKMLREALGENLSTALPVTERVKTIDDAIAELGYDHPLCEQYRSAKYSYAGFEADVVAYAALRVIVHALNEGWIPKFGWDDERWFPWFQIKEDEEQDVIAFGGVMGPSSKDSSRDPFRLALKSKELAEYAGKQFEKIYVDYCFAPQANKG